MEVIASIGATAASGAAAIGEAGSLLAASSMGTLEIAGISMAGGSSLLSSLAGGAGIFSALSTLAAGQEKSDSLLAKADDAEAEARQAENETLDRQRRLRTEALRAMGESDVSYAAAGIDLGYGDAASARERAQDGLQDELSIERSNLAQTQYRKQLQAAVYRRGARSAQNSSYLAATAGLVESGYRIGRRG